MRLQPRIHGALISIGVLLLACQLQAQPGYDVEIDSGTYTPLPWGMLADPLWEGDDPTMPPWGFDDEYTDIAIGFTFWYYGEPHTTLRVSTNGYVTFPPESGTNWTNDPIPDTAIPNNVIAPWWDDLCVMDFGTIDTVRYEYDGFLPGSRRLSVEWRSITLRGGTASDHRYVYFQVHLFEADSSIEFHYGGRGMFGIPPGDFSATIGIENGDGTRGASPHMGRNDLPQDEFPAGGTIYRFTPMDAPSYQWSFCGTGSYDALPLSGTLHTIWDGSVSSADDASFDIALGFSFNYYGTNHSVLRVSTNGYATFPPETGTNFSNDPIPSPLVPNAVMATWWDDLHITDHGSPDRVVYERDTTFPGFRRLSVEWSSVSRLSDNPSNYHFVYFQLHLLELGDRVHMLFGPSGTIGTPPADFSASLGVEDHDGTVGIAPWVGPPSMGFADFPPSGTRICFNPPAHWMTCGDCNGDETVSILDALVAAQHGVGILALTGDPFACCNVEGTLGGDATPGAAVGILDALVIAQYSAGMGGMLSCMP